MIEKALVFLRDQINDYLFGIISSNKVVLGHLLDQSGQNNVSELGLSLINIQEEATTKNNPPYKKISDEIIAKKNPPIYLNVYIMITAYFGDTEENYREALKNLSRVVRFFQGKYVFNKDNSPSLDESIEKLLVEPVSLSFEQQNNLWASLGAKYLPSLIFKVRMIEIERDVILSQGPPIEEIEIKTEEMDE